MSTGGSRNVAVFDGHGLTSLVEYSLLFRPNVGHGNVESVNTSQECVHEPREPCMQGLTLSPVFGANPIGQLSDDNGAGVLHEHLQCRQMLIPSSVHWYIRLRGHGL